MKVPENKQYVLFGGTFVMANKLQLVADRMIEGLSTKQWFLLRNLSDMSTNLPPTITMLAKETDTSRQNVTKMLQVLQRQGYVQLTDNNQDQRSQYVVLTREGKQILSQVAKQADPFFAQLFAGIGGEETEVAAGVLLKLIDNLNAMQERMPTS